MTFHRAIVKSLEPLRVKERFATDAPENYWQIHQSEITLAALDVGDEVIVELHDHQVYLRSRIGGTPVEGHDDVEIEPDETAVVNLTATGDIRTLNVLWQPPPGGVGHGYYQVQAAPSYDSTYQEVVKDVTTQDLFIIFIGIAAGDYRVRVRPFKTDGTAGGWAEVSPVTVRNIISSDLGTGQVNRDAIEQAAIDALRLDEGAVNLRHLVIGSFDNLIPDPSFETGELRDPDPVNSGGQWSIGSTLARSGDRNLRYSSSGQASAAYYRPLGDHTTPVGNISCSQADVFYLEAWHRVNSGTKNTRVGIEFRDADGILLQATYSDSTPSTTAHQRNSVVATAPAGAVYCLPIVEVQNSGTATITVFDDLYMRKRVDGNLIVDGTITAVHLATDSIETRHLKAGQIIAEKIAANQISATHMVAGTITAESGIIGSLDASKITTGTLHGDRIQAGTINGDRISGGTISGVTITGSTVQTSSSGKRIVINDDRISVVASNGALATIEGNNGRLEIKAGSTGAGTMWLKADAAIQLDGYVTIGGMVALHAGNHTHNGLATTGTRNTGYSGTLTTDEGNQSLWTGYVGLTTNQNYISGGSPSTTPDRFTGVGPGGIDHEHRMGAHTHSVSDHRHTIGTGHTHNLATHRHSFTI